MERRPLGANLQVAPISFGAMSFGSGFHPGDEDRRAPR
jgi:aryl-alcohol dehydrogenase-like predicted oxidoreductase